MNRPRPRALALAAAALVASAAFAAGCDDAAPTAAPAAHTAHAQARAVPVSGDVQRQIAELRALTAPFHRLEAAKDAGWDVRLTGCLSDPVQGGMGYHYAKMSLIDGAVDPLQPELLVYEPQQNGRERLVAVEFIVPFDAWTAPEPPQLYGQTFHRNEAFGLWVLHVWHFRHNPSGTFADWNPDVTCAFAEE